MPSFASGEDRTPSASLGCCTGAPRDGETRDGKEASRRGVTKSGDPPDFLLTRTGAGFVGATGDAMRGDARESRTGNWGVEAERTRGAESCGGEVTATPLERSLGARVTG